MTDKTVRDDRFTWSAGDVEMNPAPICVGCVHVRDTTRWTCAAYPNGIPGAIISGQFTHTAPYPGDQGIRYQPKG